MLFSKDKPVIEFRKIDTFLSLDDLWKFNWDKMHDSGDLNWLIRTDEEREYLRKLFKDYSEIKTPTKQQVKEIEELLKYSSNLKEQFEQLFFQLMDEWFDLTNKQSNRKEMYAIMVKLIVARDKVINGDEFQKLWVRRYEQMIKDMSGEVVDHDATKERIYLSEALKMKIDPKETTVKEYHYFMEVMIEKQKTNNAAPDGE